MVWLPTVAIGAGRVAAAGAGFAVGRGCDSPLMAMLDALGWMDIRAPPADEGGPPARRVVPATTAAVLPWSVPDTVCPPAVTTKGIVGGGVFEPEKPPLETVPDGPDKPTLPVCPPPWAPWLFAPPEEPPPP